jgi:hypothetical protein
MRKEFFSERSFDTIEELQEALDIWVADYNNEREHQSLGDVPSIRSFELARPASLEVIDGDAAHALGRRLGRARQGDGRASHRLRQGDPGGAGGSGRSRVGLVKVGLAG